MFLGSGRLARMLCKKEQCLGRLAKLDIERSLYSSSKVVLV